MFNTGEEGGESSLRVIRKVNWVNKSVCKCKPHRAGSK